MSIMFVGYNLFHGFVLLPCYVTDDHQFTLQFLVFLQNSKFMINNIIVNENQDFISQGVVDEKSTTLLIKDCKVDCSGSHKNCFCEQRVFSE